MASPIKLVTGRGSFHSWLKVSKKPFGRGRAWSIVRGTEKYSVTPYLLLVLSLGVSVIAFRPVVVAEFLGGIRPRQQPDEMAHAIEMQMKSLVKVVCSLAIVALKSSAQQKQKDIVTFYFLV